ncbi:ABC transporter permease [Bifidobacterium animalis subsp. animalis]|nr:ABC transporter permease [Bifidobacterium animalis subsp. animalis]
MIDTLFSGLIHGGAYALVAVGVSLIFGVTNVVNFAQGSLVAVGMMVAWYFGAVLGWPIIPVALVVTVITAILGWLINAGVIAPLEGRKPIAALLATIGVGQILDNGLQLIFGSRTRPFPKLLPTYNLQLAGVRFGTSDIVMIVSAVVAMGALWAFLTYGKAGQAIRATAQDSQAALQMGIPVKRIRNIAFVIGAVLSGLAGIFIGLFNANINAMNGGTIGLTAFVAAAIGGLGSIPGAVVGGIVLGVVEAIGVFWFGDGAHDLITFGALIVILIIRPQGLLGGKTDVKSEPMTGTFLGGARPITLPWWGYALLAAVLVASPFLVSDYMAGIGTQVAIYAIAAVGLTLISGCAGQTILGLAGSLAIGSYTSALLTTRLHWPFLLALLFAGIVAAVFSCALTFPAWKLSGHYVAIATIGLGAVMVALIRIAEPLTHGSLGIQGIPLPTVFGAVLDTPQKIYLLDVVVLIVALVIVMRIQRSHLGHVFDAIGSDQEASEALSIRTGAYKALAYAVATFLAGTAGSLLAHQYTYIDPTIFNSNMSLLILTIIVLGGMNSPVGAVFGSIVLIGAPELLRIVPQARILAYGVLLVVIIMFRPQGLFARKG